MFDKSEILNFLKHNPNEEFSKEELINKFTKDIEDEHEIDKFLSELEVDYTYGSNEIYATCKAGTVYFKWIKQDNN